MTTKTLERAIVPSATTGSNRGHADSRGAARAATHATAGHGAPFILVSPPWAVPGHPNLDEASGRETRLPLRPVPGADPACGYQAVEVNVTAKPQQGVLRRSGVDLGELAHPLRMSERDELFTSLAAFSRFSVLAQSRTRPKQHGVPTPMLRPLSDVTNLALRSLARARRRSIILRTSIRAMPRAFHSSTSRFARQLDPVWGELAITSICSAKKKDAPKSASFF